MSLTLGRRWSSFFLLFFPLTNGVISYIYFHSNDLCHVGRLAQLARALARQARGHWFKSSNAHWTSFVLFLHSLASLPLVLQRQGFASAGSSLSFNSVQGELSPVCT